MSVELVAILIVTLTGCLLAPFWLRQRGAGVGCMGWRLVVRR